MIYILNFSDFLFLTHSAPTPQNGQTHSNNLSAKNIKFFEISQWDKLMQSCINRLFRCRGGFIVKPLTFEFWCGGQSRLHSRVRFRKPNKSEQIDKEVTKLGENGWLYELLSPWGYLRWKLPSRCTCQCWFCDIWNHPKEK